MAQNQGGPTDSPSVDTAEMVYISSLALLKMLKHGMFKEVNQSRLLNENLMVPQAWERTDEASTTFGE